MLVAIDRPRAGILLVEGGERLVIGIAMPHRLFEDRRVGGDAGQRILLDQRLEAAGLEKLAIDEVEPDRGAAALSR